MARPPDPVISFSLPEAFTNKWRGLLRLIIHPRKRRMLSPEWTNKYIFERRVLFWKEGSKEAEYESPQNKTLQCLWAASWYSGDLSLRFRPGCYIYRCAHAEQVPKVCNTNDTRNTVTPTHVPAAVTLRQTKSQPSHTTKYFQMWKQMRVRISTWAKSTEEEVLVFTGRKDGIDVSVRDAA